MEFNSEIGYLYRLELGTDRLVFPSDSIFPPCPFFAEEEEGGEEENEDEEGEEQ